MYLEKLEIQGFKSFANKNVLKFGDAEKKKSSRASKAGKHGITAIVGPNGSGKSNIADAVRWVLGEQSVKLLRGKKSEDVIFSGSAKKASLSLAEVSLYLNNESAQAAGRADKAISYREIVITRRLYRDGESEYLLNNSKVRLLDISLLLAKASFGQRAYSVIGQGMVENFLNTNMAERKEFFDEATGVKMYQIKRDDAANKLKSTKSNLGQAETLLAEIEPRMKSLTRQIKKLEQRAELEDELRELQTKYYASQWHKISDELKEVNGSLLIKENVRRDREKELAKLNSELAGKQSTSFKNYELEELENKKRKVEEEKNNLQEELAEAKAKLSVARESSGQADWSWLNKRNGQLKQEISYNEKKIKELEIVINSAGDKLDVLKKKQAAIEDKLKDFHDEFNPQTNKDDAGFAEKIKKQISELLKMSQDIFFSLDQGDAAGAKIKAKKLKEILEKLKKELPAGRVDQQKIDETNKKIIGLEKEREEITQDRINLQAESSSSRDKIKYIQSAIDEKKKEIDDINKKIDRDKQEERGGVKELRDKQESLEKKLQELNNKLENVNFKIKEMNCQSQDRREEIIKLQQRAHELQLNFNNYNDELNEIKINKTRLETRLEDLEEEIRTETKSLRAIIDARGVKLDMEKSEAQERMQKLKRQLELIGGIDPETKKEYEETAVRYDFLSKQVEDLRKSINSLEKIIVELDKTIADKFDSAFSQIAKQFEKYFKILFNGGGAKLEKVYEDVKNKDPDEFAQASGKADKDEDIEDIKTKKVTLRAVKKELAGIEIQATPPGKKIKSISMLSGGERALTAIALICSIISVNPSPFVVLDEVDAALDEANSGRLGRILEELSSKTQFIVITHNRSMMYIADIIYGVTMGDDSISKLLSIKIDEVDPGDKRGVKSKK